MIHLLNSSNSKILTTLFPSFFHQRKTRKVKPIHQKIPYSYESLLSRMVKFSHFELPIDSWGHRKKIENNVFYF